MAILVLGLFTNAHFVRKRERKSLKNLLTLLLGIGILLYAILVQFSEVVKFKPLNYIVAYIGILAMYFGMSFYNFALVSFFNNFYKPKLNKDYIIVLGSGLIDGHKVSKLLGARIDRAIEFYQAQKDQGIRANLYAKAAGLDISGLGGKTALYFLPNALIREYIAILATKKEPTFGGSL